MDNLFIKKMALVCEGIDEKTANSFTEDQFTLKEFFDKAKKEGKELQVHFTKVTDGNERTVIFSNSANVGASFDNQKQVSPKVLKSIEKNHDRIYKAEVKYVGCLVTFPEKITEDTPHVTNAETAEDGSEWQWRRLYIQQIIDVKYDGSVVWKNDGLFDFNLIGDDGEELTRVSAEEYFERQKEIAERMKKEVADKAKSKILREKAVELAKTLKEEDVAIDLGYENGWSYDYNNPKDVKRMAICIKHDQLCHQNPEKHYLYEANSMQRTMHGDHHTVCPCGFNFKTDSSD